MAPTDCVSTCTVVALKESLPPLSVMGTAPKRAAFTYKPELSSKSVVLGVEALLPETLIAEGVSIVPKSVNVTEPPKLATPVKPCGFESVCTAVLTRKRFKLPLMLPPKVVAEPVANVNVAVVPEVLVMIPPPPGSGLAELKRSNAWLLPFRSSVP